MKRVLFTTIAAAVVFFTTSVQADPVQHYVPADGTKCKSVMETAGPLSNITEESGTKKTIIAFTVWQFDLHKYETALYIVDGENMQKLQVNKTGECATFTTDTPPNNVDVVARFGLPMWESQALHFQDQNNGGAPLSVFFHPVE